MSPIVRNKNRPSHLVKLNWSLKSSSPALPCIPHNLLRKYSTTPAWFISGLVVSRKIMCHRSYILIRTRAYNIYHSSYAKKQVVGICILWRLLHLLVITILCYYICMLYCTYGVILLTVDTHNYKNY